MIRTDHVSGALFVLGGLLVFAMSGDLPFGSLSFPGAGFIPMIIASLLILIGGLLAVGGGTSEPFRDVDWSDLPHAAMVTAITAGAIAFYDSLGFLLVMPVMMFALLVIIERKSLIVAGVYSVSISLMTWWLFSALRAPMPSGPFGF